MLNVTQRAVEALNEALNAQVDDPDDILRLRRVDDGLQLAVGHELDGDQIVKHGNRGVLAIDNQLTHELDGASLDVVETPEGSRLVITPTS